MSFPILALLVVLAFIAVATYRHYSGRDWLPKELRGAKLIAVEKDEVTRSFLWDNNGSKRSVILTGRADQAYINAEGEWIPIEFKNHHTHQVYETDIAQVSLQAWQFRQKGIKTAPYGFVVVRSRNAGSRKATKVNLLNDAVCEQMINRYIDITFHNARADRSRGPKCRSCGHKERCDNQ